MMVICLNSLSAGTELSILKREEAEVRRFVFIQCNLKICNAHHLRQLVYAHEQERQAWAKQMNGLLQTMVHAVNSHPGPLPYRG